MADQDWQPEVLQQKARDNVSIYGAYARFAEGSDLSSIVPHAIVDLDYARLYSANVVCHLGKIGLPEQGGVVDIGCGPGVITAGLHEVMGGPTWGIDLSEPIIAMNAGRFPDCQFRARSADDLSDIGDGSLRLVHAREFYPFSRSADTDLHMRFLGTAQPKLKQGGLFAIVQIVAKLGVADNMVDLQAAALRSGYSAAGRMVMLPQKIFRSLGRAALAAPAYDILGAGLRLVDVLAKGRVTYIYWFRK